MTREGSLAKLPGGSHVCWVVGPADSYTEAAARVLADGAAAGRKTAVFGPEGSRDRTELSPSAALIADPRLAFLEGGPLDPATMFAMFREQTVQARAEGYTGLCLVADMDWLLPTRPTAEAIVEFELQLDRVVAELDAVVVCAYRSSSFDTDAIAGALAVHPVDCGEAGSPPFRLVAGDAGGWQLSGEVDLVARSTFASALQAATADDDCVVDVGRLDFIDVAGMRLIAESARDSTGRRVRLRGASPLLQRMWEVTGFDRLAPQVELIA